MDVVGCFTLFILGGEAFDEQGWRKRPVQPLYKNECEIRLLVSPPSGSSPYLMNLYDKTSARLDFVKAYGFFKMKSLIQCMQAWSKVTLGYHDTRASPYREALD